MGEKAQIPVRKLTARDVDAAADVLTRAFFDYPMWTWIMPDDEHRRRALPVVMRSSVLWGLLVDETYGAGDPLRGVAVCAPAELSDAELDPDGNRTGYAEAQRALGKEAEERLEALIAEQRPLRERDMPRDAIYVPGLGVDPAAQRTGFGSALLRSIFARADAEGRAVYLETENAVNVPYYVWHGFEVLVEDVVPGGGPRYWTFLRTPATRAD